MLCSALYIYSIRSFSAAAAACSHVLEVEHLACVSESGSITISVNNYTYLGHYYTDVWYPGGLGCLYACSDVDVVTKCVAPRCISV